MVFPFPCSIIVCHQIFGAETIVNLFNAFDFHVFRCVFVFGLLVEVKNPHPSIK
jgi:hypothetical protein